MRTKLKNAAWVWGVTLLIAAGIALFILVPGLIFGEIGMYVAAGVLVVAMLGVITFALVPGDD